METTIAPAKPVEQIGIFVRMWRFLFGGAGRCAEARCRPTRSASPVGPPQEGRRDRPEGRHGRDRDRDRHGRRHRDRDRDRGRHDHKDRAAVGRRTPRRSTSGCASRASIRDGPRADGATRPAATRSIDRRGSQQQQPQQQQQPAAPKPEASRRRNLQKPDATSARTANDRGDRGDRGERSGRRGRRRRGGRGRGREGGADAGGGNAEVRAEDSGDSANEIAAASGRTAGSAAQLRPGLAPRGTCRRTRAAEAGAQRAAGDCGHGESKHGHGVVGRADPEQRLVGPAARAATNSRTLCRSGFSPTQHLVQQTFGSFFEQVQHLLEALRPAVVRIRHCARRRRRHELHHQSDAIVTMRRRTPAQLAQILLVHRQDQIVSTSKSPALHGARTQRRQVDAATARSGDRALVRRLAHVIVVRARRIDLDRQAAARAPRRRLRNTPSALGERQMFPMQTKRMRIRCFLPRARP